MKFVQWALAAALVSLEAGLATSRADERDEVITALKKRLDELDQKVKVLERHRELDNETAETRSKEAPRITIDSNGFGISSADTNFVLRLRGYIQADSRWFIDNGVPGADTFLLRRVRPIIEGTVFDKYDYRVMLDFGANTSSTGNNTSNNGMLQDAYLTARLFPEFQIQAGKFKEPVGLERLQSGRNLLFIERGFVTQLVPNRDVGVQVQGNLFDDRLTYALGAFNGVADNGSDDIEGSDDDKDVAGRVFAMPFRNSRIEALRGLGFGVGGTFGSQQGALRSYVTPGQQRFFTYRTGAGTNAVTANVTADGEHWRLSPQAYYYWGPFGILGEYAISSQEVRRDAGGRSSQRIANTAWQIGASYFLTGEENGIQPITPRSPFNLHGDGWGAWELAARVGQLDIDHNAFPLLANPASSFREAFSWGVGLNWHLNKNLKLSLNYDQTEFKGGSSALLNKGEKAIFTRVQISF
jgi:phosphate-selective porin OprO and OprP